MTTVYKVHPAAECFRLMRDDELEALAADIRENGLHDPITIGKVTTADGEIIEGIVDGRNRLRACGMAGVTPQYEMVEFQDEDALRAFVASRNERRDLTKGEKAMAMAFLYPNPDRPGRGKKGKAGESPGFSQDRLRQARAILHHSVEMAKAVRDGTMRLDEALEKVKAERKGLESTEAKLERLRREAPDLADMVQEDRLSVNDAIAALDNRIEEDRRRRQTATELLHGVFKTLHPRNGKPADWATRLVSDVDRSYWPDTAAGPLSAKSLKACAEVMAAIADGWKE